MGKFKLIASILSIGLVVLCGVEANASEEVAPIALPTPPTVPSALQGAPKANEPKTGFKSFNPTIYGLYGLSQGSNAAYRTMGVSYLGGMVTASRPFGTTNAIGDYMGDANRWLAYTKVSTSKSSAVSSDGETALEVNITKMGVHAGGGYLRSNGKETPTSIELEYGIGVGMGMSGGIFEVKGKRGTRSAVYSESYGGVLSADVMPLAQLTFSSGLKVIAAFSYSMSFKDAASVSAFSDNAAMVGVGYGF